MAVGHSNGQHPMVATQEWPTGHTAQARHRNEEHRLWAAHTWVASGQSIRCRCAQGMVHGHGVCSSHGRDQDSTGRTGTGVARGQAQEQQMGMDGCNHPGWVRRVHLVRCCGRAGRGLHADGHGGAGAL